MADGTRPVRTYSPAVTRERDGGKGYSFDRLQLRGSFASDTLLSLRGCYRTLINSRNYLKANRFSPPSIHFSTRRKEKKKRKKETRKNNRDNKRSTSRPSSPIQSGILSRLWRIKTFSLSVLAGREKRVTVDERATCPNNPRLFERDTVTPVFDVRDCSTAWNSPVSFGFPSVRRAGSHPRC